MLTEKHNDQGGWKNKLEGLTELAGEAGLEKNAAWEKLHSRLEEKPRKKRAVWYWAAACLLAALLIPLMMVNKKKDIVVKNDTPQQKIIKLQPSPEIPVIVQVPALVEKKKMENSSTKKQHITEITNTPKKEEPVAVVAQPVVEKDPAPIIIDTVTEITAAIPVKKKLSVVHINELESATAQFYPLPNYVQKTFKIKFKNGKAASQTIASQQQYEGGFKIKLSPKN